VQPPASVANATETATGWSALRVAAPNVGEAAESEVHHRQGESADRCLPSFPPGCPRM